MSLLTRARHRANRLHNQIVVPLMAASALVGVVATIVGVFLISGIVDRWVEENALTAARRVEQAVDDRRELLSTDVRLVAEDPRVLTAVADGDARAIGAALTEIRPAVGADILIVLDESGRVVALSGSVGITPGDIAFPEDAARWGPLGMSYVALLPLGDARTITALRRIGEDEDGFRLAVSEVIDSGFLARAAEGTQDHYCLVDESGGCIASTFDESAAQAAHEEWFGDEETVADVRARERVSFGADVDGVPYQVQGLPLEWVDDPTRSSAYVLGIVDRRIAAQTQSTTIALIAFWSVLAIGGLWAAGVVVARRISRPMVGLAEGAESVAEGDYTTKVAVTGANELAQLAQSFNDMTDSLRDRNESLTKKVLELATLYEMSRVLGGTLELGPLLESVLDSALRIFDVEAGYIILRDRETGDLELAAWRGTLAHRPTDVHLKSSISEWVVREGRPLIFNPTRGEHEQVRVDSVTGATAALAVPLVSAEGPVGAVAVGSKSPTVRFDGDDVRLLSTIANHATIAIGNIELFSSLQEAYLATVRSLAAAVDAKDPYTRGHSDRVAVYSMTIARAMELSPDQARTLEMAAYLHDIGKIGVQESILLKPGTLDEEEMGQMRHHPLIGASILRPVVFPWPVAPIIRHHHERWDGGGYPSGLRGEEIPLLARLLALADSFEAMTADRPYRRGRDREDAIRELERCSGSQFDPQVVEAFVGVLEQTPAEGEVSEFALRSTVQRDEARAVFAAACDGMFASFRRLGGPRLASNVEKELNEAFDARALPCSYSGGRLFFRWDDEKPFEQELDQLKQVVDLIAATMEKYAGSTLVDHFYEEALGALSGRLQRVADTLQLRLGA